MSVLLMSVMGMVIWRNNYQVFHWSCTFKFLNFSAFKAPHSISHNCKQKFLCMTFELNFGGAEKLTMGDRETHKWGGANNGGGVGEKTGGGDRETH